MKPFHYKLLTFSVMASIVLFTPGLTPPLPAFANALKSEQTRKTAPDFELQDASGKTVQLSNYKGKVVLLNFWATWCAPCKAEIPWFNEFAKKYGPDGFAVLGVSMDNDHWTSVKPFMEKMAINYPIMIGTRRVAYLYGDVEALPVTFFLDREQKVAAIFPGAASRKQFEQTINALLTTQPSKSLAGGR